MLAALIYQEKLTNANFVLKDQTSLLKNFTVAKEHFI